VVDPAAPLLLIGGPSVFRIDCAVEGIHRSTGCRSCSYWQSSWRRSWRRSRRGCWKWCRCSGDGFLRESCGATPSHHRAAELLLGWRPRSLPLRETGIAIVGWRSLCAAQQPQKKGDQEQQAQKTARRNQASEISTGSNNIEIAATADVLVCSLLDVISLTMAHISQRTPTATSTADTASCAVFALSNAAGAIVASDYHCACSSCTVPAPVCPTGCHSAAIAAVHHDCNAAISADQAKLCPPAKAA